jgi:hypothetical protein
MGDVVPSASSVAQIGVAAAWLTAEQDAAAEPEPPEPPQTTATAQDDDPWCGVGAKIIDLASESKIDAVRTGVKRRQRMPKTADQIKMEQDEVEAAALASSGGSACSSIAVPVPVATTRTANVPAITVPVPIAAAPEPILFGAVSQPFAGGVQNPLQSKKNPAVKRR